MILAILVTCIILLLTYWYYKITTDKETGFFYLLLCPQTKTVDGGKLSDAVRISKNESIFKNSFDIINLNSVKLFDYIRNLANEYKESYMLHVVWGCAFEIIRAEDLEDIMKETALITKGVYYDFLEDFLKEGLLLSTENKWHSRRKLLTPSFHFSILEKFIKSFRNESLKFVENLSPFVGKDLALQDHVPKATLNIICETALGVKLNEIDTSDHYRKTINKIEHMEMERAGNIFMYSDFIYKWFGRKKEYVRECDEAHKFTSGIINRRRKGFNRVSEKKFALLDNLLNLEKESLIDHQGVCEEVDTLTFEGFDTTSTGIMFTIFMLGQHPDVQEKVYEEVKSISIEEMTIADFSDLKYLECVIKESLRLYPPVPYISRKVVKPNTKVGKLLLPKDCEVAIHIFDIHRDPKHFPDPEKFDPNRFTPEHTVNRHPYAYIPFSAGLRNCIGQRFAMLELKVFLAALIKSFKIFPITKREDLKFKAGLILRPNHELLVKFEKRL